MENFFYNLYFLFDTNLFMRIGSCELKYAEYTFDLQ